jgi:hypothetical protein
MNDATSDELRAMKQPVTTGPGEAIRQRFSTAEAASMAAGCLRGLLKRHGVQLDAEAQRIIQGVLEMVHETLGMDNDGNVVRTAKESATPRLASPGVEALRALLEEVVLVINYDPPACQTPKGAWVCHEFSEGERCSSKGHVCEQHTERVADTIERAWLAECDRLSRAVEAQRSKLLAVAGLVNGWHNGDDKRERVAYKTLRQIADALGTPDEALASPAPAAEDGRT